MTSIQTFDDANDVKIEDCIAAINQAGEADVSAVVGALFNGDFGSGDPEYKRVRTLLNDAADDGIIGKKRDGNRNVYTERSGLPEPDVGGDGEPVPDTPDQVEEVSEDLPTITREHATGLDDLADEVPEDVEPDDSDSDSSSTSRDGVAATDSEIQSDFTVGDNVPEQRVSTCNDFVLKADGDHEREQFSDPLPRRLDVEDPKTREFRIVKKNGRVKSPSSGLVVSDDAIADGYLPEDFDIDDPEEACIYAESPYCGSMRKLSVTEGADGIRLKFRSFNLPKTSPRVRSDEYLSFDDEQGVWTWTVADEDDLALDALARRARAGAAIPHKATLDEDGNLVDDGAPDEDDADEDDDA